MVKEARITPYILYKCMCFIPAMIFYDAKPQSVKTPVAAKPKGILPNYTCQCLLVILSYDTAQFKLDICT